MREQIPGGALDGQLRAGFRNAQFDAGGSIKVECIFVKILDAYNKYLIF
jgi:hypothetical protein